MMPASTSTNTTAMAMPVAVSIFFEVPKNGQLPRYWIKRMLLMRMALKAKTANSPNMAAPIFYPGCS
jgi:hypothetical protein